MTARFYNAYIQYLNAIPINRWPRSLLNEKTNNVLSPEDFTLGSIRYVIGMNENGDVVNQYVHNMVTGYAKRVLYEKTLTEETIEDNLKRCVIYTEKIRKDYRNPAAHRQRIGKITAKECLDYIVDTQRILKEILKDMLI